MEKRLIDIAYYLHAHDALGYSEAQNLMIYLFGYHPDLCPVNKLFREVERMQAKGVKPKEFPNIWNNPYIFS